MLTNLSSLAIVCNENRVGNRPYQQGELTCVSNTLCFPKHPFQRTCQQDSRRGVLNFTVLFELNHLFFEKRNIIVRQNGIFIFQVLDEEGPCYHFVIPENGSKYENC